MDKVKEAFSKIKEDITFLKDALNMIQQEIEELKHTFQQSNQQEIQQSGIKTSLPALVPTHIQAQNPSNALYNVQNPTQEAPQTAIPAHNLPLYGLKAPNSSTSTGNRGVPTDSQSVSQSVNNQANTAIYTEKDPINQFQKASELIKSLDSIKREIRSQFKKLTTQEMLVFSTIYQLENQGFIVDYPLIAKKLSLSESSMRDYAHRIIKKGIPLLKLKENNKRIILSISPDLKKITSLETIIQLREI